MSMEPGSVKARRKLATYGKAKDKGDGDFDVPDSPERSDGGNSSGPANNARLHSMTRPAKSTPKSRSPKRPPQKQGHSVSRGVNTVTSSAGPMLSMFSAGSGDDPFDVPSSDEDAKKPAANPLKPAIKRRKVPGKDDNGTLAAVSETAIERTPRREEARKKPAKERISQVPPPRMLSHLSKKSETSMSLMRESNKLSTSTESSDKEGNMKRSREGALTNRPSVRIHSPLREDHPRPSAKPKDQNRALVSNQFKAENRQNTQQPFSPTASQRSPTLGPKTPPPELPASSVLSPNVGRDLNSNSAFSYMSPSGLDFLGLEIAETPVSGPPHTLLKASNVLSQTISSPARTKLKDRLARRDGVIEPTPTSHPSNLGKAGTPSSEEEADLTLSQNLLDKRNDDAMDTLLPSSQVEIGSSQRVTYGAGPRHTYAASNRTLRKDENASEDDMFASLVEVHETTGSTARRIRVDVQPRNMQDTTKDSMDFDDEEQEGPSNALRNIHELRQAGANAQLHGETEALLDEIESSNTSTIRSGLVSLLRKLEDTAFRDKFAAGGLDGRVISRIDPRLDLLSRALLSMALLQLLTVHSNSQTLLGYQRSNPTLFLLGLLTETDPLRSVARNRKSNVSKALQQDIEQVCHSFTKSSLWKFGTPSSLTPRTIALHLLECLARYTRGTGMIDELLPSSIMEFLVGILATHANEPGDDTPGVHVLDIRVLLATMESATLRNIVEPPQSGNSWRSRLLDTLSQLFAHASGWNAKDDTETLSHLLRLVLNLTNNNIEACTVFARSEVLKSVTTGIEQHFAAISSEIESQAQAAVVDNLILTLGFLINLAEHSRSAREMFSRMDSSGRPLDTLLQVFSTKWVKAFEVTSEQESRDSVPLGYLAVLLAFLCIEDANRTYVASKLSEGSLKHLLIAVEAFLSYHRKVAEELQGSEEGAEIKAHFIERVQGVLNQLKKSGS